MGLETMRDAQELDDALDELCVVNFHNFLDPADRNKLLKVTAMKASVEQKRNEKIKMRGPPATWEMPTLWGHDEGGLFAILEGNKRLIACAAGARAGIAG